MSTLTLKYHGVPARGIQGLDGQQGRKGQSVYIGFVNDFFDYTEYDIDPAVRYTKRKVENLANTVSWRNYKNMYNTINVDNMYYTGEFILVDSGIIMSDGTSTLRDMDVVTYNEKLPGESIANSDDEQTPIESYEFKFIRDIGYTNASDKNLSYVDVYDFVEPDDLIDNILLNEYDPIPEYTVHIDVNHITYDYSDLKRIALMKFNALGENAPYDMWDIFTTHDEFGNQIEGKQTPETYKTWLDDPDMYPLFVREKLEGAFKEYMTGVTNYYGAEYTAYDSLNQPYTGYKAWPYESPDGRHYLVMPDNDEPAIEDLTYALTYFKQPVKTYPQYKFQAKEEISELMQDYEGYLYIGISDDTMYKVTDDGKIQLQNINDILTNIRKSGEDTPLIDQTNFTLSDLTPFINALRDYTITLSNKSSKELLPTNDLVVWHSGTGKLKLPTTLSASINVGDIIYFYTNIGQYSQDDNSNTLRRIEYMAIVTEDMIGCTLQYLIDHALIVKPFDYSVFNNVYDKERAEINRSTIITAINRIIPADYDLQGFEHFNIKSMEEVLTQNDHCALRLIAANTYDKYRSASLLSCIARDYNSFENIKYKDNTLNIDSTYNSKNQIINKISTNDKKLAIRNLMVNTTKQDLNFELSKCVYDNNVVFDNNGYFIFDKVDAGNISYEIKLDENTGYTHTHNYYYTIKKSDLIPGNNSISSEYAIGYIILDKFNNVYAEYETFDNEVTWHIQLSNNKLIFIKPKNKVIYLFEEIADKKELAHTDFRILTTIRNRTGFRYYSNATILRVFANTTDVIRGLNDYHHDYNIVRYEVETEYPSESYNAIESTEQNIQFDIDAITCELHIGDNAVNFKITPLNNVLIKDVYINTRLINEKVISNSWITFTDLGNYTYSLDIKDNIPDIFYNDDVYSTNNIEDFMILLSNPVGDTSIGPLFNYLLTHKDIPVTQKRSVTVRTVYLKDGNEYSESYVITLPGFDDPRRLPELDISLVNDYKSLSEINTIDNGVLCNQFRTYAIIKAGNLDNKTWLMYNNDVTVDFTIELDNTDNDINCRETEHLYSTLKALNFESNCTYNNFYTLHCSLEDSISENVEYEMHDKVSRRYYNIAGTMKTSSYTYEDKNYNYYIINQDHPLSGMEGESAMKNVPANGVYHTMSTTFKNIPVRDLANSIKIIIDFEWANPVISSLYLKFKISDFTIHYNTEKGSYRFVLPKTSDYINELTTESLCVNISPISLTACPPVPPFTLSSNVITNTVKIQHSNTSLLLYTADFYNPLKLPPFKDTITKGTQLEADNLNKNTNYIVDNIKSSYYAPKKYMFNDNIQLIDIIKETPSELLNHINMPTYYDDIVDIDIFKISNLYKNLTNTISLSVFYDADFFNPRYRNDKETFYFNDVLYEADRYRQIKRTEDDKYILTPLILSDKASLQIRTNEEMEAIDTWNFEYQISGTNKEGKDYVLGEKSTYGQGFYYLYNTDLKKDYENNNPYENDKIMSLEEIYNLQNTDLRYIKYEPVQFTHSMIKSDMYPLNNLLFRILTRYMRWEYLYPKDDNNIGHATMVTPFEALLLSLKNRKIQTAWSAQYLELVTNLEITSEQFVPYNLCYNLSHRLGRHPEQPNVFTYLMLRMPTITNDSNNSTAYCSQVDNTNYLQITESNNKNINEIFKQDYSSINYK